MAITTPLLPVALVSFVNFDLNWNDLESVVFGSSLKYYHKPPYVFQ